MTGKEIMEALSNVDERYIEEAENGKLRKVSPVRYFLPLAACLCLIVTALRFLPRQPETAVDENAEVMQETMLDSQVEIVVQEKDESLHEEPAMVMDEAEAYDLNKVFMVILRIEEWTEKGFTGVVEDPMYWDTFAVGDRIQVEFTSNIWTEVSENGGFHGTRRVPTEADFPTGTLVKIQSAPVSDKEAVILAVSVSSDLDY